MRSRRKRIGRQDVEIHQRRRENGGGQMEQPQRDLVLGHDDGWLVGWLVG